MSPKGRRRSTSLNLNGDGYMIINREWAMPNKWTFQIPPIRRLLNKYVGDGKGWIDPFAGENSPAEFTNDLNPTAPTTHHMDALDFIKSMHGTRYKGCTFDPPYSLRQVKECYEGIGRHFTQHDSQNVVRWTEERDILQDVILPGGLVISFGWTSTCMGEKRGFQIIEILLVSHGPAHNDTIVTVEKKNQMGLTDFS